jgi:hypothetical protein
MTSRLSFTRRALTVLACGATLFGVSACGGGSSSQVSPAVVSKIKGELENSMSAAKATEIVDCLVPTLKAHGVTTMAAANSYGSTPPPWLKPAALACAAKAGETTGTSTGG